MEDEIFITGMSGKFPDADNVAEYWEKLCKKVDCITEEGRRWIPGVYGVPKRMGLLKELDKFDNLYFGISHKSSQELDPQGRILLEVVYESIVDAGYDPETLRGKKIGVYIGTSSTGSDSLINGNVDLEKFDGYFLLGYSPSLLANRISYAFDFKGPSMVVDTACASGVTALYSAVQAIRTGDCDAAIVGSSVIHLNPEHALAFQKLNMLSKDGKCKPFDASGDGYAKSEAIVSIFIQRCNDARRMYASVVNIKTNTDGYKIQGITFPSPEMQKCLMQNVLKECNLDPCEISYLEAHATGTKAGDPVEIKAITDVYCCGRKEPLLIGSVKSNIGHTEVSSGLCGIIKILLAMETGLLPPNLHFNEPIVELKPLIDKQIKVITELTPWNGTYAALNGFGFGGVNVSTILKRPTLSPKTKDEKNDILPQLILSCGRTEESVLSVFENPTINDGHREFLALFYNLAYTSTKKKPYRGYKILGTKENIQDIQLLSYEKRPVWYVFSGMGSQWPAMARDLMKIKIFRKSITKSQEILKPYVPDLMDILTNGLRSDISIKHDANTERKIIPAFVSIATMQIALVDVLNELGLKPDGIIGHSVGEIGCAYADGCLTHEQMLLASYWRGKATEDSDLIQGSMAATGMTWSEAQKRCPKDIYPVCHNAEDSVTISGPVDSIKRFMSKLKDENVFVQEVNTCGYAYHCDYVLPIADKLQLPMEKLIPDPKHRSDRWISSSYPEEKWKTTDAQQASASYFVHNLLSPVLFYDAMRHIPKNAIAIEIGPHQQLQPILKREIGTDAVHIGLMKRNADNIQHLLSSIGKMYTAGLDTDIEKLYSPFTFPVPRNTPMISPLIKWDHSETWNVPKWDLDVVTSTMHHKVDARSIISTDRYLLGHCIDGLTLFPAAGYIVLVWKTFSSIKLEENINVLPVSFENVKFKKAIILSEKAKSKITVSILRNSGYFEVSEKDNIVCTGFISSPIENDKECISNDVTIDKESLTLNEKDIYDEFWLRGYEYGPAFHGIKASNFSGSEGILNWNKNWIVYLDTLFQFSLLSVNIRSLLIPTGIESLIINPMVHEKYLEQKLENSEGTPVKFNSKTKEYISPGVYAKNVKASYQKRRPVRQRPLLEEYRFVPYIEACCLLEEKIHLLKDYDSLCLSVSQKLLQLSGKLEDDKRSAVNTEKNSDVEIDKYLKSEVNDYVLLKCFINIMNNFNGHDVVQLSKECVRKYLTEFENDILHKVLLEESILRTASDIVFENNMSRRLKVLEITEGCHTLSSKINEYIPVRDKFKISYSVLHPKEDLLNKDKLPENTAVVTWDNNSSFEFEDADLFILYYLKQSFEHFIKTLKNAAACLKDEGFILLVMKSRLTESEKNLSNIGELHIPVIREDDLEPLFKDMNLNIICKKTDSFTSTLFLLRRHPTSLHIDSAIHMNIDEYGQWIESLKEKITQISQDSSTSERLWLVAEDSQQRGIIGLVNCIRQEPGGHNVRCVFIRSKTPKIPEFSLKNPFYKVQLEKNLVMNVLQNGVWGSYRHIRWNEDSTNAESEHAYLTVRTIGDLSTLEWKNSSLKYVTSGDNESFCYVYYTSLNFRDVMLATGRVPLSAFLGCLSAKDGILGFEFSGRTSDGRRVMGITSNKGMATSVLAKSLLLWDVPDEWSLEEAATIPVVYATAYYALILRGGLEKGERILIHSGSGGVGQAAITIALSMGCDVYTTVGSKEKKEFLMKKFPEIQEGHISNSRNMSFEKDILNSTNGKGVHVVLNSLAEKKLFATLNCLAYNGRFLEIGAYDLANNSNLGMAFFLKNVSFHGINLDTLFNSSDDAMRTIKKLVHLVKNGIYNRIVKPLNTTVYNYDDAQKAFRYMESGRHTGKVVLKIREEEKDRKAIPSPNRITAVKQTLFDPKKTYILIGGLGGIGLELSEWLIERGAKIIVISSRSGVTTGYQKICIRRWEEDSVKVVITKLNAVKPEEAKSIIILAAKLGPVGGIFNLALVLRDALMVNQSVQNYLDVCEPKVVLTQNLDLFSRELCPDLDWFVCFSSVVCGRGNAGQSNYGYATSAMEGICEERVNKGLPGLAIQWGAVGDVGIVKETMGPDVIICGTVSQRIRSCLEVLEKFLQQRHPVVSSFVPHEPGNDSRKIQKRDLMAYVSNIFGINDISSINPETNLSELGMDSLMAVELKQVLESNFDTDISFTDLRNLKVKDLKKFANQSNSEDTEKEKKNDSSLLGNIFGEFNVFTRNYLNTSETIVQMNEITDGVPLFLIHPGEGTVTALETLAKLLPCPVYGIQNTAESPRDSLENLSAWYWKHVKEFNISKRVINLSGYSYGAIIAFEMALQAEQDPSHYPEIQNIIFLEGSPSYGISYIKLYAPSFDEATSDVTLQIAALRLLTWQFPHSIKLDEKELLKFNTFPERLQYTTDKITAVFSNISSDTLDTVCQQISKNVRLTFQYNPKGKLKKDVYLIKASRSFSLASQLSEMYDLDKVCEGKVTAHTIEGTHQSILHGSSAENVARLMKEILSLLT